MYVQEPVHDDDTCTCQGTGAEGSCRLSPRCKGDTVTRAFYQHDWLGNFVFRKSPSWERKSGLKSIRDLFKQVVHLLDLFCGHCLDDEHLVSTREQSNEV